MPACAEPDGFGGPGVWFNNVDLHHQPGICRQIEEFVAELEVAVLGDAAEEPDRDSFSVGSTRI